MKLTLIVTLVVAMYMSALLTLGYANHRLDAEKECIIQPHVTRPGEVICR